MHPDLERADASPSEAPSPEIARRLRDLPTDLRPPFDYEEFQRRVRQRARPRRFVKWQHAAAAGAIFTVVAVFAVWSRFAQSGAEVTLPEPPLVVAVDPMSTERARVAERWMANLPAEPAIVRVETRFAVADLQDRIAWVDDALTDERFDGVNLAQLAALQHERARLINSLAQVRYAETLASQLP